MCTYVQLLSSTDSLLRCLEHPFSAVRHMAARCLAVCSRIMTSDVMERVISHVVPLLAASDNVIHRQGAIEAISCILYLCVRANTGYAKLSCNAVGDIISAPSVSCISFFVLSCKFLCFLKKNVMYRTSCTFYCQVVYYRLQLQNKVLKCVKIKQFT